MVGRGSQAHGLVYHRVEVLQFIEFLEASWEGERARCAPFLEFSHQTCKGGRVARQVVEHEGCRVAGRRCTSREHGHDERNDVSGPHGLGILIARSEEARRQVVVLTTSFARMLHFLRSHSCDLRSRLQQRRDQWIAKDHPIRVRQDGPQRPMSQPIRRGGDKTRVITPRRYTPRILIERDPTDRVRGEEFHPLRGVDLDEISQLLNQESDVLVHGGFIVGERAGQE